MNELQNINLENKNLELDIKQMNKESIFRKIL